jgi:hypothetical protein
MDIEKQVLKPGAPSLPKLLQAAHDRIVAHWEGLQRRPGNPVSGLEQAGAGWRIRYQAGAIYVQGATPAWVYGAIGERYDALGGAASWLGLPISDEMDFVDGGRVSAFEHGCIYWWPDTHAIELNDVVVHYTGLACFGETDLHGLSGSDSPYATLGVNAPGGPAPTFRTSIYTPVDKGATIPDLIEIYRGKPAGLVINCLLQDHGGGDPEQSRAAMDKAVTAGSAAIAGAAALIPGIGPVLGPAVGAGLTAAREKILEALNDFVEKTLGFSERSLGIDQIVLSPKQMILLATRPEGNAIFNAIGWRFQSELLERYGATYRLYFGTVPA